MRWPTRKPEQQGPVPAEEQPQAHYPNMPTDGIDLNTLCRACSNGVGDGICSYHANRFRIQVKRVEVRAKYW